MVVPRLVIAAPSSGSGKTTVATGLMAALRTRGLRVSPHKVGPDYIDPGYHALATGRPGRNLDPWLTGEDRVAPLFLHGARDADIAVVEGVMGLYDGAGSEDFASTAHVARLIGAPVVLVVDAARQGRSVAALVQGFASFDTRVRLAGVILNRVGSRRHEEICRAALDESGISVLGVIPRVDGVATPSRHLGLIPVAERSGDAVAAVERMGALVADSCDLEELVALARSAPPLPADPWTPAFAGAAPPYGRRPVVAVAGGAAFTFGYAEQVELLAAAGAEVVTFDPLRDERLPENAGAVVIGGGFPEMYAAELSANEPLRHRVAAFDGPIVAECAGLLYLARELDGHPMCGRLDITATMTGRLTLGYRDAVATAKSVLTREGERYRGHEFHRTATDPGHATPPLFRWKGAADGFAEPLLAASYLHLHWAGSPELAERLVAAIG
ncbi:cobyrinate a,c-diamide synthase [Streptosporangium sp. NBC_01755]|uniref:cobyrinate a,c-diamide synthase n=1 Tax=unclassified Streptosporangium TaxID=2632669 RepID=UPI002DDA603F|nr:MULTISPECIES: cobyrinate a,c-diamide synthase [unclassified Streptosporangium]WSA29464.1 cobyrinate a,c-diamide synthase [Streptosporangium sp. NBC_01810]WSC99116.1 cobyrinate a,c-diamide synthase [Streptosporangium sp. NBC_01755]